MGRRCGEWRRDILLFNPEAHRSPWVGRMNYGKQQFAHLLNSIQYRQCPSTSDGGISRHGVRAGGCVFISR
jgi:hypothetical protein